MKSLGFDKNGHEWVSLDCPEAKTQQDAEQSAQMDGIEPRHVGYDDFNKLWWVQGPRVRRG